MGFSAVESLDQSTGLLAAEGNAVQIVLIRCSVAGTKVYGYGRIGRRRRPSHNDIQVRKRHRRFSSHNPLFGRPNGWL